MNVRRTTRFLSLLSALFFTFVLMARPVAAQQVTYYDFDVPATTQGQTSYACPSSVSSSTLLFCLNDGTGLAQNPSYLMDTFPALIDPNQAEVPPASSSHEAVQMTTASQNQSSSLWFALPQKVANGFNAYFTFKFTPTPNSYATADGIAFVIQNSKSAGGGGLCSGSGAGANAVGGGGGCIGYGSIDNSVAVEFDTYLNPWDPQDNPASAYNDNHIAIQNCGAGLPNSPDHTGACLVHLSAGGQDVPAISSQLGGVTMADGAVHQVVISYSGPSEAVPNLLQVYLDPPFNAGTHTPTAAAVPVLTGTYDLAANLNLLNSAGPNGTPSIDSAYVGFTSATGAAFEQHEVMNWTFTPHTSSTQTQPIAPGGQPTVFPFGSHVDATTYPADIGTSGISQVVTANPITPKLFSQLIDAGPFKGSKCQVYDDTGGNCIVYSVSCVLTGTTTFVQCPTSTVNDPISVKSAYNDSAPAVSPGYLQGDPFYNLIGTITGGGGTATVTCLGECAVTTGQTVTIAGSSSSAFNGTITVLSADPSVPNVFTFTSTAGGSATGGYLTSTNVQNIFFSYSPLRLDATTTGKVNHFSDFVVTALTTVATNLAIQAPSAAYGSPATVTVAASSADGVPTGTVALTVDGGAAQIQPLAAGVATFSLNGLSPGTHTLAATYAANGEYLAGSASGSLTINGSAIATLSASSLDFGTLYLGSAGLKSVTLTNTGTLPMSIQVPFIQDVHNGDSKEFIAISFCPKTLQANRSCSIQVLFIAGPHYVPQTAVLEINDNAPGSPQSVGLTALVIHPQASLSPKSLSFGTTAVGSTVQSSVLLKNTGATPLTVSGMTIQGGNAGDFSVTNSCPASLAAGASCTVPVSFTPSKTGTRSASLVVTDSDQGRSQQVSLAGGGS